MGRLGLPTSIILGSGGRVFGSEEEIDPPGGEFSVRRRKSTRRGERFGFGGGNRPAATRHDSLSTGVEYRPYIGLTSVLKRLNPFWKRLGRSNFGFETIWAVLKAAWTVLERDGRQSETLIWEIKKYYLQPAPA